VLTEADTYHSMQLAGAARQGSILSQYLRLAEPSVTLHHMLRRDAAKDAPLPGLVTRGPSPLFLGSDTVRCVGLG